MTNGCAAGFKGLKLGSERVRKYWYHDIKDTLKLGQANVFLTDIQSWWMATFSLDMLLALVIVEWLRAASSRLLGEEYVSAYLPIASTELDGCLAQLAVGVADIGARRMLPQTLSATH